MIYHNVGNSHNRCNRYNTVIGIPTVVVVVINTGGTAYYIT